MPEYLISLDVRMKVTAQNERDALFAAMAELAKIDVEPGYAAFAAGVEFIGADHVCTTKEAD
jgi:hypothetical protein